MNYLTRRFSDSWAVLSGSHPPDENCFPSNNLQIVCNSSDTPWTDDGLHAHGESDEAYLVLDGEIALQIGDQTTVVSAGEICFVRKGVFHAVTHVEVPYRGFVIRAPSINDKVRAGHAREGVDVGA